MAKKLIPAEQVDKLLKAARNHGLNVDELLSSVGLQMWATTITTQGEWELPADLYCKLLQKVAYSTQKHWFGLPGTEEEPFGGFRMLCLAISHSHNLRSAIDRAAEFYKLYGLANWRFELIDHGSTAELKFITGEDDAAPSFKTLHYMYILQRFWAWLSGQYSGLKEVHLMGDPEGDVARYRNIFFDSDIKFNKNSNSLFFDCDYLDAPIIQSEQSLMDFVETAPYQLLVIPEKKDDNITEKIRFLIGSDFTRELPSFDEIIDMLHTSATTLRRKLKKEGTTFQQIKDDARKEAAIAYLKRPELNVTSSAIMMGFDDPSAFTRSFKRWTGMAPVQFRAVFFNQLQAEPTLSTGVAYVEETSSQAASGRWL